MSSSEDSSSSYSSSEEYSDNILLSNMSDEEKTTITAFVNDISKRENEMQSIEDILKSALSVQEIAKELANNNAKLVEENKYLRDLLEQSLQNNNKLIAAHNFINEQNKWLKKQIDDNRYYVAGCCFIMVGKLDDYENIKVLITTEGRGKFAGRTGVPGGKIEPGETPNEAAIREAKEEVEMIIDPKDIIAEYDCKHLDGKYTRFIIIIYDTEPYVGKGDGEIASYEWSSIMEKIPGHPRPGFIRAYNDIRNSLRH